MGWLAFDDVGIVTWIISLFAIFSIVDYLMKRSYATKFGIVKIAPYIPVFGSVPGILVYGIGGGIAKYTAYSKDSFLIWLFNKPIYCITKPEEIQSILMNRNLLDKGSFYKYVALMGNALLVTGVGPWRMRRKLLNKCFNNQQLNSFSPIYLEFAKTLEKDICNEMTLKDLAAIAEKSLISTFFSSVAGFKYQDLEDYLKFDVTAVMKKLTTTIVDRYLNPLYHLDFIFFNSPEGKTFVKLNKLVDGAVINVLETKKKGLHEEDTDGNYYFLDTLIRNYDDMENMKCDVKFFSGAGLLVFPALSACLVLLGMHQDSQKKMYKEIVDVFGNDGSLEIQHLPHLVYTDMVINESLRLFSPVPFIMRRGEYDIEIGGKMIPKNTDILIAIQNLHRNADIWEDPLKFIPERFLPEEVQKRHPASFVPFSLGPRNCIGMKYTELVLKFNLVTLVKKFQVFCDCKRIEDIKLQDTMFPSLPTDLKLKFLTRTTE